VLNDEFKDSSVRTGDSYRRRASTKGKSRLEADCSLKLERLLSLSVSCMTRSELVAALAKRFPQLTAQDADVSVKEILEAVSTTLAQGNRIEIRGFGSFCLNYRPPRMGRNPKSGETVSVPGKWSPHFKAGKELRELVDR